MFKTGRTDGPVTRAEFDSLVQRVQALEKARAVSAVPDRARYRLNDWGSLGDGQGEPYYHRQDLAGALATLQPWVSSSVRFAEQLTSTEFVKATLGSSLLLSGSATIIAGGVCWLFHLPWYGAPVVGVASFAVSAGVLVILNRSLIHRLVKGQADKSKRRAELKVSIDKSSGGYTSFEFLYLRSNVRPEQLQEFAAAVLAGASLSVNQWVGAGGLFTRSQYDGLMGELELTGHCRPPRGNVARQLTAKGRALFKGLANS